MGRCPVRSIFEEALPVLTKNQDKFRYASLAGAAYLVDFHTDWSQSHVRQDHAALRCRRGLRLV
jgi:hypothetical protein